MPTDVARRGAHRGPKRRGRGWIVFAWAALATGVLVGLGVVGLFAVNNGNQFTGVFSGTGSSAAADTATPTPTVQPTTNPAANVTILNGTTTEGLATRAADQATTAGWTVGAEANASSQDVATSTVYYSDPANEGEAKGLAATLGGIAVAVSDQFPGADLTAVLGTDYVDPAAG
ncbi:LytR C-terminal domain-containing protein [Subtercola sp. YIM 133946]|uniref:LytR C-terminal domain-containing protein n=1 Tax=Subtercola sp. YIM 133946 TaxID=3118909 RepID=UPI002F93B952